jgi:intracellular septation protein
MPTYGIVSKVVVFLAGFATLRLIGRRRVLAMPDGERDALLAAAGRR